MPDSDWSDKEELYNKYKGSKTSKKRRRSVSVESESIGKMKKKKTKEKKQSKRDYERETKNIKDEPRKHNDEEKARRSTKKSYSSGNIDSENENLGNKRIRKEQKSNYNDNKHDTEQELTREKYARGARDDDYNQPGRKDRSKKQSSRKSKYCSDSENEKEKRVDREKKGKYKENSESRRNSPEMSRNKFEDESQDENSNRDDSDRHGSGSDKPFRYWSFSRGPVRKNSDSYWNKYSDRLKESNEHVEVGPRYYSSGDKERKDKISDITKVKEKVDTEDKGSLNKEMKEETKEVKAKQQKTFDPLTSRTGGAYIPPARLKMMQESITDKGSAAYQRLAWEALKKSIQGYVNKVNTSNILVILKAIYKENIVRGRGLLCRALIQAQVASPSFTNVYAAFIAALNCKFPRLGELLLKRLIVQFRRGFKRNDKTICITAVTFIAHLVNQEMAHEIVALEILTLLLDNPTEDSVEVAIAFLKECGMKLTELSSKGVLGIFDTLRNLLHEGKLDKRVQYMIEVMFQIRKEDFKAHPAIVDGLDNLVEGEKIVHLVTLEENHDPEDILNVFKFDPDYEANEAKYQSLNADSDSEEEDEGEGGSSGSEDGDDESDENDNNDEGGQTNDVIVDKTETNLVALRKTIYLTIQSSLDFEECAHKLLRMELKPGQEIEMAHMFLDCCSEQRTYEKFFGLLSQRFCQINRSYIGPFEETFRDSYATIHRMSNDKLRNIAKLFAHLLFTDAISWDVLAAIKLNEDDTNSSSRIFIKILFLELSEYMGLAKLNQRVKDPSLQTALEGLFPRDNPKHTRFAINFFTSIGLGGLTDELREHLKTQPKPSLDLVPQLVKDLSASSSSSSDSSSSSSDSSDSSSSSESSSSESEEEVSRRKRKKENLSRKKKSQTAKKVEKEKLSKKKKKRSPPRRKRER